MKLRDLLLVLGTFIFMAVLYTGLAIAAVPREVTIKNDDGGKIIDFITKYSRWDERGVRVRIDGDCMSSCTFILGLMRPDRFCVTKRAVLGFHYASISKLTPKGVEPLFNKDGTRVESESGTKIMMEIYPPEIQSWILRNGGLKSDFMYLKGKELQRYVQLCKK